MPASALSPTPAPALSAVDPLASVEASRVLFGFVTEFHYLFVPLTLGLMGMVALMDSLAWWTQRSVWERAGRWWGRLWLLNFVCGLLTGWPLRHHLKTQWSAFSAAAGNVVEQVFTWEGDLAPVLLSLAVAFAWRHRTPRGVRVLISTTLAAMLVMQSLAILALNAWMQYPVGVRWAQGRWSLPDPLALFHNPLLPTKVLHTVAGAYVLGGMVVLGVSAWCLLRGRHLDLARASFRAALPMTSVALGLTAVAGHESGERLAQWQPAKFAAIEALWTPAPADTPLVLWALPDAEARRNVAALEVPGLLGWLTADLGRPPLSLADIEQQTAQAIQRAWRYRGTPDGSLEAETSLRAFQVTHGPLSLLSPTALKRPPGAPLDAADLAAAVRQAVPPVGPVFWSFRVMVGAWTLMVGLVGAAWLVERRQRRPRARLSRPSTPAKRLPPASNRAVPPPHRDAASRWLWRACVSALPLGWLANGAGWMVCEMGRQPWTITGVLSTAHALGPVSAGPTALLLLGSGMAYAMLLGMNLILTHRWLKQGQPAPVEPSTAWAPTLPLRRQGPRVQTIVTQAVRQQAGTAQRAQARLRASTAAET